MKTEKKSPVEYLASAIIRATIYLVLTAFTILLLACLNYFTFKHQQRQIDQLCTVMPSLIQHETPPDQRQVFYYDKLPPGEYSVYFANYKDQSALMVYYPKRPNGKTHFVYVFQVPKEILSRPEIMKLPLE